MKSRLKRIRVILVIAISLSICVCSAYVCYYTVAAADFLSPNLNFETFDQEFLFSAYENELKVFVPSNFLNDFRLITYLSGHSSHFLSSLSSYNEETLVLRC
jgi:hypothetical protein